MVRVLRFRPVFLALTLLGSVPTLSAQSLPVLPQGVTPQQAAQLLRQNPQAGMLVQNRLQNSGLSPDQVRLQLQQAGFPSNLLDQYLENDGSYTPTAPTATMLRALDLLGVSVYTYEGASEGDTVARNMGSDSLRYNAILDYERSRDNHLPLYGLDVFRKPTTQFEPVVTGPVSDDYVLGPGDVMVMVITGAVQTANVLEVTRDGFVVAPQVGQVYAANLTLGQFKDVLFQRARQVYSTISRAPDARSRFSVSVARLRRQIVRVIGEVSYPGEYSVSSAGGVLAALYNAGGLTRRGNFRNIEVRRGNEILAHVDLYDYLQSGRGPPNLSLQAGDIVFVPMAGPRVKLAGAVRRPAEYELKPGEGLADLLSMAGGPTPDAGQYGTTIDRIVPIEARDDAGGAHRIVSVDLSRVLAPGAAPVALSDGDSVTVPAATHVQRLTIAIDGAVWQPGRFQLDPGMRLSDLIAAAGGLKPDAYAGRVQIIRTASDSTLHMLAADLGASPPADPVLEERDRVTVYGRSDFITRRSIGVSGAVRAPGTFAFADSMTLTDAILMAGGLREDASLMEAEIGRMRRDPATGEEQRVVALRVPLDSNVVLDTTGYVRRPAGAQPAPTVYLEPYDQVFIRAVHGWEKPRIVTLTGEVRFPGEYALLRPEERLSDLIERAGGLTAEAYPGGVGFFRAPAGRVGVDLEHVLRDADFRDNFVLGAGDSINIPRFSPYVMVSGAVQSPTAVAYVHGRNARYYVDAAGGPTQSADNGRTYVQQPNGAVERGGTPEPGATVVVPAKNPGIPGGPSFLQVIAGLTQIIAAATTIVVVLRK